MPLKIRSRIKDWRRRRLLTRAGIRPELSPTVYRAGARSGVWPVLPDRLRRDSVVYSFGSGDNIAWELDLIQRFGLTVHAFDPTPESIAWVTAQDLPDAFVFHPIGLAAHDGTDRFRRPPKAGRFNYVPAHNGLQLDEDNSITCPVQTLPSLQSDLGHAHIDLLKLDIEGGEYAVVPDVIAAAPEQLLVEFHHNMPSISFSRTLDAMAELSAAGYRIFDISPRGLELGFLRQPR